MPRLNNRVVITGFGVVSSIGLGKAEFWSGLIAGKSGISPITSFDSTNFNCHVAGEVKNFNFKDFGTIHAINPLAKTSQFSITATKMAIADAGLDLSKENRALIGVIIGTTTGDAPLINSIHNQLLNDGLRSIDEKLIPQIPYSSVSANVAREFDLSGVNIITPNACAASNYAIARSCELIKAGEMEIIVTGGSDSFAELTFNGFSRLMLMASEKIQPFDKNRKGLLLGEGAGILILESLGHALSRGATILAEIVGSGFSCDSFHIAAPHPEGIGAAKAIQEAIASAQLYPKDIDYISAHGTGTPANDLAETLAVKKVFSKHAKNIPISSIKSMLGHCLGAASAFEAIASCLIIQNNVIPPTINLDISDPQCDLDYVPNVARSKEVNTVVSNAFAFGGNNAVIVLKRFKE